MSISALSKLILNILFLTLNLWASTPHNGQTCSNNSSAFVGESFECVWPFCGVCALRVKITKVFFSYIQLNLIIAKKLKLVPHILALLKKRQHSHPKLENDILVDNKTKYQRFYNYLFGSISKLIKKEMQLLTAIIEMKFSTIIDILNIRILLK